MNRRHSRFSKLQAGFTIVELMIATSVFGIILIVITSGVTKFTGDYYKGLSSSAVQTTARDIMTTISQGVQFGGGTNVLGHDGGDGSDSQGVECIGNVHFYYDLGIRPSDGVGAYGVVRTTNGNLGGTNCLAADKPGSGDAANPNNPLADPTAQELLGPQMRLTDISISDPDSNNLVQISVGIAYGDNDLLCSTALADGSPGGCSVGSPDITNTLIAQSDDIGRGVTCKSQQGQQFCAIAHLSTTVQARFQK